MGGFMGMKGVELGSGYIPTLFVRTTRGEDGPALLGTIPSTERTGKIALDDVHNTIKDEKLRGSQEKDA
jgi:hypothetical protein